LKKFALAIPKYPEVWEALAVTSAACCGPPTVEATIGAASARSWFSSSTGRIPTVNNLCQLQN
jgi:hypothetical protein